MSRTEYWQEAIASMIETECKVDGASGEINTVHPGTVFFTDPESGDRYMIRVTRSVVTQVEREWPRSHREPA